MATYLVHIGHLDISDPRDIGTSHSSRHILQNKEVINSTHGDPISFLCIHFIVSILEGI